MPKAKKKTSEPALGYEAQLWHMADALRNNMDAAEYKHVVLGLLFLKYISDAFEANPRSSHRSSRKARIRKTRTSIAPRASFGSRRKRVGSTSRPRPRSRQSARWWTTRWRRSSATNRR